MENKANKVKMLLLSIIVCLAIGWTGTGRAFEPWDAEVMTNVNLRRSPGTEGRFITVLRKGERVLIKEEHDEWYKVVLEREAYGYIGWLYGKFLKKVHTKEKSAKLPSLGSPQATPITKTLNERPLQPLGASQKTPVLQGGFPVVEEMEKKGPHVPIEGKNEKKSGLLLSEPQKNTAQGNLAVRKEVEKRDPPTAIGKRENKERELVGKPQKNARQMSIAVDKGVEKSGPHIPIGVKKEKKSELVSEPQEKTSQQGFAVVRKIERARPTTTDYTEGPANRLSIKVLIRFLLRLSPIVLSCIALLFSYNALRIAKQAQQ